jgi:hypothetical protein
MDNFMSVGNAILYEEDEIINSIIPSDENIEFNKPLLRKYPALKGLEKELYIPPLMIAEKQDRRRVHLIADGGRSGINLNYSINISLEELGFGEGEQVFVESRKGVGSLIEFGHKEKLIKYWSKKKGRGKSSKAFKTQRNFKNNFWRGLFRRPSVWNSK